VTIDIRAKVYCSLGSVISGSINDSYLQGVGLVKTRGEVVLNGQYSLPSGTLVEFAYLKSRVLSRVPRSLRVLSAFVDPYRNITTVELGCKLTYLEDRKPAEKDPKSTDENSSIPCEVFREATIPISANYVFQECLTALGISSSFTGLTNKFSVETFDLSGGYIQAIDDLLVSECYLGYLDESENLIVRSLNETVGSGPLITESQIIDISQIAIGDLPGDAVKVRYNTLKLRPPQELSGTAVENRNWEYELSSVRNSDTKIETLNNLFFTTYLFPNYTITETRNTYDSWNRRIKSVSDIKKSIIVANPSLVNSIFQFNIINVWDSAFTQNYVTSIKQGINTIEVIEREEKYYTYTLPAIEGVDSCGYKEAESTQDIGSIKTEEYRLYQTAMGIAAAFNINSYIAGAFFSTTNPIRAFIPDYSQAIYLTKRQLTEYQSYGISLSNSFNGAPVASNSETTQTITTDWASLIFTPEGQQLFYKIARTNIQDSTFESNFQELIRQGAELVMIDKQIDLFYGANYGLQVRPTPAEINNKENSREEPAESVAEVQWATGGAESTTIVEFSMPYAPDDEITWSSGAGYGSIPSDAAVKAANYGRIQNRLLLGNRYGINLQVSSDLVPKRPFDPVYLQARGLTGQYRVNATNWVFDASGIVSSIDAIFWAGIGANS